MLDALFTLVLALTVIASVVVFMNRGQVGFGALGIVQSPSMVSGGYAVGDVVYAKSAEGYAVGDVIVFYRAPNLYDRRAEDLEKNELLSYPVWIHEVIEVSTDELGRKAYLTKGTDNATDDFHFVPHDFVLGRASKTPAFVGSIVRFVYSVKGIIYTVIVPCAIMFVYLAWDLIMLLTVETVEKPKKVRYRTRHATTAPAAVLQVEEEKRYTFVGRLFTAEEKTRRLYSDLKNILLGYEGASACVAGDIEKYVANGKTMAYLDIRGAAAYVSTDGPWRKIDSKEAFVEAVFELRARLKDEGCTPKRIRKHDYACAPSIPEEAMALAGLTV